jgi:hypothetical protein
MMSEHARIVRSRSLPCTQSCRETASAQAGPITRARLTSIPLNIALTSPTDLALQLPRADKPMDRQAANLDTRPRAYPRGKLRGALGGEFAADLTCAAKDRL